MSIALELAKKGNPSPNPFVGAVIVKKGKIIGKGFHKKAGLPHAEVEAINSVKDKLKIKGSTLYVILEPCSHYGKTPPCTNLILKYKIKRIVCAVKDPTRKIKGIEILRKKGLEVKVGVLEKEARKLNEIFFHYSKTNKPFVAIKAAASADNKIGLPGKRVKITGKKSDMFVHKLRSKYDAILVGSNTVLIDDPKLTSRIPGGKDPRRIILDGALRTSLNLRVFLDSNVTIVTLSSVNKNKIKLLEKKGIEVLILGKNKINLKLLLKKLGKKGITSLLVEGGSKIHKSFLEQNLVNKIYLFKSKKKIGKKGIPLFNGFKPKFKTNYKINIGSDTLIIKYSR